MVYSLFNSVEFGVKFQRLPYLLVSTGMTLKLNRYDGITLINYCPMIDDI